MIELFVVKKLQKELGSINNMVKEINGKAQALSRNGVKTVKGKKVIPRSLLTSMELFKTKVEEHQTALNTLKEKVDHLHDLITIYEEDTQ